MIFFWKINNIIAIIILLQLKGVSAISVEFEKIVDEEISLVSNSCQCLFFINSKNEGLCTLSILTATSAE